jgi:hypothetical protein
MAVILAMVRPDVSAVDRWLLRGAWNVPSEWNGIADIAIRGGVIERRIGAVDAPWRRASVVTVDSSKVAVVALSDFWRSHIWFIDEHYRILGSFSRITPDPATVTDEARGYGPLSHIWPVVSRNGRLETLVGQQTLVSEPPRFGTFAYLATSARETEVLFVCELRGAPGPSWGELDRVDVNGDGVYDFVVLSNGRHDVAPLAVFVWDPRLRGYAPRLMPAARAIVSWWSTAGDARALAGPGESVDDVVRRIMPHAAGTVNPHAAGGANH